MDFLLWVFESAMVGLVAWLLMAGTWIYPGDLPWILDVNTALVLGSVAAVAFATWAVLAFMGTGELTFVDLQTG